MKLCKTCDEVKQSDEFSKSARNSDGLQSKCKSCVSEYYKNTAEHQKAKGAAWRANNPERHLESIRAYRESEHGSNVRKSHRVARKAIERGATNMPNAGQTLAILISRYGNQCLVPDCGRYDIQVDHVIPLSKGGTHTIENLQLLCTTHNLIKGNRNCNDYRGVI